MRFKLEFSHFCTSNALHLWVPASQTVAFIVFCDNKWKIMGFFRLLFKQLKVTKVTKLSSFLNTKVQ